MTHLPRKFLLVQVLLLSLGLWRCKSASQDLSPVNGPGTLGNPSAAETAIVNSTVPSVFTAGTYPAVYLAWGPRYSKLVEGQDWAYTPDPAYIRGDYRLTMEPVATSRDSVRLFIDGLGHGPDFKRTSLGTFWVGKGEDGGKANNVFRTLYPITDRWTVDKTPRIYFDRLAFSDRTVYTIDVYITQFIDKSGNAVFTMPKLTFSLESSFRPAFTPVEVVHGIFRRVSPAVVKDPYK